MVIGGGPVLVRAAVVAASVDGDIRKLASPAVGSAPSAHGANGGGGLGAVDGVP